MSLETHEQYDERGPKYSPARASNITSQVSLMTRLKVDLPISFVSKKTVISKPFIQYSYKALKFSTEYFIFIL